MALRPRRKNLPGSEEIADAVEEALGRADRDVHLDIQLRQPCRLPETWYSILPVVAVETNYWKYNLAPYQGLARCDAEINVSHTLSRRQ